MIISKDFKFESAHNLRDYDGKCADLHGHSYFGTVWIDGPRNKQGFVLDYGDISTIIDYFDHKNLNDLDEFIEINPTAENLAFVIMSKLLDRLNEEYSVAVKIHETASSSAFITNDPSLKFLAV